MSLNAEGVEHTPEAILSRMSEEIRAICDEAPRVWEACVEQAAAQDSRPGEQLILTGCGDSYYAGLATRRALEEMTGRPVVALPAFEVAHYLGPATKNADLVGVSVSGKVGRTIEAVEAHAARGGEVAAVTAYPDSDLARTAGRVVATGVRGTPGPVPGTANYVASMLGLLALGAAEAQGSGWVDAVTGVLSGLPAVLERALEAMPAAVAGVQEPVFTVGSGPDWGTANYAVAKLLEAAGAVGVPQDLEEWAHEQYFVTDHTRTVVVFGHDEAAGAGARRVAQMTSAVGGNVVGFGSAFGDDAHTELPAVPPFLSPLVTWVPAAVFARQFALHNDRYPFGIDRPGRMQTVDEQIYVPRPSRA